MNWEDILVAFLAGVALALFIIPIVVMWWLW